MSLFEEFPTSNKRFISAESLGTRLSSYEVEALSKYFLIF